MPDRITIRGDADVVKIGGNDRDGKTGERPLLPVSCRKRTDCFRPKSALGNHFPISCGVRLVRRRMVEAV
jgi:hypothetical protein